MTQISLHSCCRLLSLVSCARHNQRICNVFYVDPAVHKETPRCNRTSPIYVQYIKENQTPHHFRLCRHFEDYVAGVSERSHEFCWVENRGLTEMVMGLREGEAPSSCLDKPKSQNVETCEIRMEPSLLDCDLRDTRARNELAVRSPASQGNLTILFGFVFL